jgi:hypothetical protein
MKGSVEERRYPDLPFGPGHSFGPNSRRLESILKLDRAERRGADESDGPES